ncbi:protein kinase domain-containing protein [Streptomyces sp. CRN 30]|uniref:protein kinase domain-containing protein n=1 Tax=Streptomyces sp. CRN 30 TaxID=3075613 RepID=UPI002A829E6B|nr:protein kinase [Streptomyces sp. CRN 30]
MSGMLDNGTRLATENGDEVEILGLLGAGGQGEVYRVATWTGEKALKWYYPTSATPEQEGIVRELVHRDFHDDRFLWPEAHVGPYRGSFGYLMGLRPERFKGLPELFRRQLRTDTRALLRACLHTVESYQALHMRGVAYRDISWGNIFFDPATGEVLICDNDNAVVDGDVSGISGTMKFMAPELVRGDPDARPGTQSDLHSLAVLLFMLLMNHHPFEGRRELGIHCLDDNAERRLYGRDPLFVFDPADDANAPDPVEHTTVLATWAATADRLRELFRRVFTEGVRNPAARVRESEWRDALRAVLDSVVECAACGRQNMTEPGEKPPSRSCWGCGAVLALPPRLTVTTPPPRATHHLRLGRSARVQEHHLVPEPERHDCSDGTLVAELVEHPSKPGRFGIANRSARTWTATRSDGGLQEVEPGRTVPLRAGLELDLGEGVRAVVHAE